MKINRRKFLSIGGLSALTISFSSSLFRLWGSSSKEISHSTSHSKYHFEPTWMQGNPHLGCSNSYFYHHEPTIENQWSEIVHFHMTPSLRDSVIYDIPFKMRKGG